jgi:hypothetical protein
MTPSTRCLEQLDLGTLNATQSVVTKALQSKVCECEQAATDAASRGEYRSAQQYKEWAFAVDLAIYAASSAFSSLFLETLDRLCTVEDTRTVQLPNLGRSVEDQYIDTLATEVASHQPCPEEVGQLATGQHQ